MFVLCVVTGASTVPFRAIFKFSVKNSLQVQDRIAVLFAKLGVLDMLKSRLSRKFKDLDVMRAVLMQCTLYGTFLGRAVPVMSLAFLSHIAP